MRIMGGEDGTMDVRMSNTGTRIIAFLAIRTTTIDRRTTRAAMVDTKALGTTRHRTTDAADLARPIGAVASRFTSASRA